MLVNKLTKPTHGCSKCSEQPQLGLILLHTFSKSWESAVKRTRVRMVKEMTVALKLRKMSQTLKPLLKRKLDRSTSKKRPRGRREEKKRRDDKSKLRKRSNNV